MIEPDPTLVTSNLSCHFSKDDITVELCIYKLENTDWSLEVINSNGTSKVWDDMFSSDQDAHDEFMKTVAEEGMSPFQDDDNVIQFPKDSD